MNTPTVQAKLKEIGADIVAPERRSTEYFPCTSAALRKPIRIRGFCATQQFGVMGQKRRCCVFNNKRGFVGSASHTGWCPLVRLAASGRFNDYYGWAYDALRAEIPKKRRPA